MLNGADGVYSYFSWHILFICTASEYITHKIIGVRIHGFTNAFIYFQIG
jgi:hypothetical protein